MIIDSHCHLDCLNLDKYDGELKQALLAAKENGVGYMLCVSIDMENFPKVLAIAEQHQNIHASVGLHPNEKDGHEPTTQELIDYAEHPKIIAIGETGLDYFRSEGDLDWQRERFVRHIHAANETKLPLIIHTREAEEDTLTIMREECLNNNVVGVMHCFTGTWEMAEQCLDMGFYISFSGIVTFKNAAQLQEVARRVPSDRMLIETDSPYLAPVPFRGSSNEPAYVKHVAEFMSELRGESYQTIATQTTDNYFNLFNLQENR